MSADTLTVLTAVEGCRAAKLYTDLDKKPDAYLAGLRFDVESVPVASLDDLASALDTLRHEPRKHIIRGELRPDAHPDQFGRYARRCVDRVDELAPFREHPRWYFTIDADKTEVLFDAGDPAGSVKRWRATLPAGMREAGLVFQFSASQHLSPTLRGHASFWLAEQLGGPTLKAWAIRHGFDGSIYTPVSVLYTADPVFAEGLTDPLGDRELVLLEGPPAQLDLTEAERGAVAGAGSMRAGKVDLGTVGDPSPDPEAAKAREGVRVQLASAFAEPDGTGKRWELASALGGACAKLGIPPEEPCAILEALRGDDVSDFELWQGLDWACNAYSLEDPSKATGQKVIGEQTTKPIANRVQAWLVRLAEATKPTEEEASAPEADQPWGSLPLELFDAGEDPPAIPYLIAALNIGPGKPTTISDYANTSKTPFALELAVHVACPTLAKFQGHHVDRHVPVLYVCTEGARNARRKLARIARAHSQQLRDLPLTFASAPPGFLTIETAAELGERAVANGARLVVIDTYNSAFDGSKDRNSNEFSLALKVLGDISDRLDVTFVALLHNRKGDKLSRNRAPTLQDIDGHNSVAGAVQAAIRLYREDDSKKQKVTVVCVREVDQAFEPYSIDWVDVDAEGGGRYAEGGLRSDVAESSPAEKEARAEANAKAARDEAEATAQILAMIDGGGGWVTWRDLTRRPLAIPKGARREAFVLQLTREGVLVEKQVGASTQYYRPAPSPKSAEAMAKRQGFLTKKM